MFITIKASKGYVLTDGETYAETISLAENASVEHYYEITQEEYEKILENEEKQNAEEFLE